MKESTIRLAVEDSKGAVNDLRRVAIALQIMSEGIRNIKDTGEEIPPFAASNGDIADSLAMIVDAIRLQYDFISSCNSRILEALTNG